MTDETRAAGGGGDPQARPGDADEGASTAPGGAPPVDHPVGASWTDRPVEPGREAEGARSDEPPDPEAVRREARQTRYLGGEGNGSAPNRPR